MVPPSPDKNSDTKLETGAKDCLPLHWTLTTALLSAFTLFLEVPGNVKLVTCQSPAFPLHAHLTGLVRDIFFLLLSVLWKDTFFWWKLSSLWALSLVLQNVTELSCHWQLGMLAWRTRQAWRFCAEQPVLPEETISYITLRYHFLPHRLGAGCFSLGFPKD